MKIEKVNDHQIRCTLTKADLADRHMKLSELAYGTDKAKVLFRDMMQQAAYEFGFEADDIPLMIEAIPLSGDCIVLIITKVEDPEELDTRFSRFAPTIEEDGDSVDSEDSAAKEHLQISAGDVIDLFKKLHDEIAETASRLSDKVNNEDIDAIEVSVEEDICRLYRFEGIDEAIRVAHVLSAYYTGTNTMYRMTNPVGFYLMVHQDMHTPEDFNKICNIISEYGHAIRYTKGYDAFLKEHGEVYLAENALQTLSQI